MRAAITCPSCTSTCRARRVRRARSIPALPPGLPEVIMQAMSVDKDKRYQTMPELRAALEKYL